MIRSAILTSLLAVAALTGAQEPPSSQPAHPDHPQPQGQIIFQRSEDHPQDSNKPTVKQTPEKTVASITDAERSTIAFNSWDLDLHINPATSHLAAFARLTIRNTSIAPI